MQLSPRYGTDPIITLDGSPSAILAAVTRQRSRLSATLAGFTEEQWAHPSRCAGWSNRDVVVHLDSTNAFWSFSIAAGLRGEPTQFLATFDPVASPAQLVAGSQDVPSPEVLDRFTKSTESLIHQLGALDDDGWSVLAEAPPGHIAVSAVAHHALWDSWVHERDILLPQGLATDLEADEIAACLRYVAALAPAFAVNSGRVRGGKLTIEATEPDISISVDIGNRVAVSADSDKAADLLLTGDAVELVEALSIRQPLARSIRADTMWMVSGLAEVFDVPAAR